MRFLSNFGKINDFLSIKMIIMHCEIARKSEMAKAYRLKKCRYNLAI